MVALRFVVERSGEAHPRHLRALVTSLLEDGLDVHQHRSNVKPFTVHPPVATGDGFALLVSVLDEGTLQRLMRTCERTARTGRRFGQMRVRLARATPDVLRSDRFETVLTRAAVDAEVVVQLRSPMVFRTGRKRTLAEPVPSQVFGHYRARWNHFAPPEVVCNLAFDDLGLEHEVLEGRRVPYRDAHRRDDQLVELQFDGFVGTVLYKATGPGATVQARRWLHALARFGEYCGTGANTTIGMGATRYLGAGTPHVVPDCRSDEKKVS